ncbi:MAG: hypothetical protein R3A48_18455 [Polyangiales bacterium]
MHLDLFDHEVEVPQRLGEEVPERAPREGHLGVAAGEAELRGPLAHHLEQRSESARR